MMSRIGLHFVSASSSIFFLLFPLEEESRSSVSAHWFPSTPARFDYAFCLSSLTVGQLINQPVSRY